MKYTNTSPVGLTVYAGRLPHGLGVGQTPNVAVGDDWNSHALADQPYGVQVDGLAALGRGPAVHRDPGHADALRLATEIHRPTGAESTLLSGLLLLFVMLFKEALINMMVRRIPTTPQIPTLV